MELEQKKNKEAGKGGRKAGETGKAERLNRELLAFIEESPCSFYAVESLRAMLVSAGFTELSEGVRWQLSAGDYFVTRNQSALIAFTIPETETFPENGIRIAASHSDSPSFQIKEHPEMGVEGRYVKLNVEKYGGMLCAPWFDRPLSAAGRLFVRGKKGTIREVPVNLKRDALLIPNVAIHMNRAVNEGYKYDPQVDMLPLYALGKTDGGFLEEIAKAAGVKCSDILGHDLFLYNRTPGSIWGPENEFVSAPRLDDLQCAFGTIKGFLAGKRRKHLSLCCVFDNEEVGSATRQGAGATFLEDTLRRIALGTGMEEEAYYVMLANGFMVSADNAHAVHPNHPELTDPTNRPYIGGGIVIKYNAQQKYCTNGYSAAFFKELCEQAGVPCQSFVNRSDMPGGSTLGNISNTKVALRSVDIGLAQLAMHSPYETAGTRDTYYLTKAMTAFYE